jgi:hypothetical protein
LTWFDFKKRAAPLYHDETHRRMFATASGRPKGADKLKKLKLADDNEVKWWRRWFSSRSKRRSPDSAD